MRYWSNLNKVGGLSFDEWIRFEKQVRINPNQALLFSTWQLAQKEEEMQTFRHEVRQEIKNILKKYNIEDRDALFEELVAIFDEVRKPEKKGDLVDGLIFYKEKPFDSWMIVV